MGEIGLPRRALPLRQILLAWLMVSALLLLASIAKIAAGVLPDPDDTLRLVQVRDLLAGQGWFDLAQHRISPNDPPVMHWSRLVDLPLAAIIALVAPLAGQATAEMTALLLVPLLTLLCTMLCVGRLASRLFDREGIVLVCLAIGFLPMLLWQFQPLRIDHHGWQICAVAAAMAAVSGTSAWRGGALAGLAMAVGMSISLELLPVAAVFGGVLASRWLRDRAARPWLVSYLQALSLGLAVLFALTRGWADLALYCDAITVPHLMLFGVIALGVTLLAWAPPAPAPAIVAGLVLSAAMGVALFGLASPQCLRTPFGALDPVVREYWYDNVLEGQPVWRQGPAAYAVLVQLAVALGIAVGLARSASGPARRWWAEYLFVYLCLMALGAMVWRSMAFASVLAALPLGYLLQRGLQRIRTSDQLVARLATIAGLSLLLAPTMPLQAAKTLQPASAKASHQPARMDTSKCELGESSRRLSQLPRGTVFAPLDLGPSILRHTGHAVVATSHHRAEMAMKDVIMGFTGTPEQARAVVTRHGAGYVVLCTDLIEADIYVTRGGPLSFAAALRDGTAPAWLEPVDLDTPSQFRIWRVRD